MIIESESIQLKKDLAPLEQTPLITKYANSLLKGFVDMVFVIYKKKSLLISLGKKKMRLFKSFVKHFI